MASAVDSRARAPRHADLDPPRRHLGVFGTFSRGGLSGGSLWTIPLETCSMALAIRCVIVDMGLPPSMLIGVNSLTIAHESRNGSPAPLSSSAADTATSPRWRTTESNRGNRFTARPVRSPMLLTEPQSSPASTNSSGNSPGRRPTFEHLLIAQASTKASGRSAAIRSTSYPMACSLTGCPSSRAVRSYSTFPSSPQ